MEPAVTGEDTSALLSPGGCQLLRLSRVRLASGGGEIQTEIIVRGPGRSGITGEAGGPALSPDLGRPT